MTVIRFPERQRAFREHHWPHWVAIALCLAAWVPIIALVRWIKG